MEQINNRAFQNFPTYPINNIKKISETNKKNELYQYTGFTIATTSIGSIGGYLVYSNKQKDFMQKLKNSEDNISNSNIINFIDKVQSSFADLITREKEGRKASFPNCIMLVGEDKELNNKIIKLTGKNCKAKFEELNSNNGIIQKLRESGSLYRDSAKRTLLHIKNLSTLLNPKESSSDIIESLKSVMSSCAENYGSTLIFNSTDPEKLDKIAIEPHRVKRIDVNINNNDFVRFENNLDKTYMLKQKLTKLSKSSSIAKGTALGLLTGILFLLIKILNKDKKTKKGTESVKSY